MNPKSLRKSLSVFHLVTGITVGFIISLIFLSGSIIVYKPYLEKVAISDIAKVSPPSSKDKILPLQTLLNETYKRYPEYKIQNLVLYGSDNEAYSFRATPPHSHERVQIYVDQYRGTVLGTDNYKSKFMQWVYDFHVHLFLGKTGRKVVALLAITVVLLAFTGLALVPARQLKRLWIKSKNRFVFAFNLHNAVGMISLPFILIIAFTGAYWGFPVTYRTMFEFIAPGKAIVSSPSLDSPCLTKDYCSLDTILNNAQKFYPHGKPTLIFFPKSNTSCFSVRMKSNNDYARRGDNHIYLHPVTGHVISANLWDEKPLAEKLTRSMYFIHFGEFAGDASRILWIILGLSVPILYFTGFYMWYKKRIKRKKKYS
ncbi:PepSY-associated TM helix domain-containing protein [Porphyromonas pogonae]|uniref:PepSY-associated TM helix domain-containing protein n=1 Tax=Porphyromonas pogonae TaxID=867595 RepID=UPI002E7A3B29|nr:PepSY-associated TM helix domain-containing protein [Porphyromonas pogonae]